MALDSCGPQTKMEFSGVGIMDGFTIYQTAYVCSFSHFPIVFNSLLQEYQKIFTLSGSTDLFFDGSFYVSGKTTEKKHNAMVQNHLC